MSERRFVLADFTHMSTTECLRIYEAGNMYTMPRAVAHAAAKHELVARERPADWTPPSILSLPEVLTEADVVEAEAPTPPVAAGDRPAVGTGARQMWRRLPARTRDKILGSTNITRQRAVLSAGRSGGHQSQKNSLRDLS
jgi:hypothetical protein